MFVALPPDACRFLHGDIHAPAVVNALLGPPFWLDVAYGVPDWKISPYANWAQAIYGYTKTDGVYKCRSNKGWTQNSNTKQPGRASRWP